MNQYRGSSSSQSTTQTIFQHLASTMNNSHAKPYDSSTKFSMTSLGVPPDSIGFGTLTLSSDKHICILETTPQGKNVVIVDINNPTQPVRRRIAADSAIMHPTSRILALRTNKKIQIYNLDLKSKMKTVEMQEAIIFWKWINVSTLALVTPTRVYHWSMEGTQNPKQIFLLHDSVKNTRIVNYCVDVPVKWCLLIGVTQQNDRMVGRMQLFSVDKNMSQPFAGHAASFTSIVIQGGTVPSTLLCFAVRESQHKAKLHIIEVGGETKAPTEPRFAKAIMDVYFPPEAVHDFPVAIEVSPKHGVVWLLTTMGFIHCFDIFSGECMFADRFSDSTIFTSALHTPTGGILAINVKGEVKQANLTNDVFEAQFQQLFSSQQYDKAAALAARSPGNVLRNAKTLQMFQAARPAAGQQPPILQYFKILMDLGTLNEEESIVLTGPVLQQGKRDLLRTWLQEEKLTCSERLGDLVRTADLTLALAIYLRAETKPKVIECFAELGQYDKILSYSQTFNYTPNYPQLLQQIIQRKPEDALRFGTDIGTNKLMDVNDIVTIFLEHRMLKEVSALLLDVLTDDNEEEGHLQTRLLEIYLLSNPPVADQLLSRKLFTHFDKKKIAARCESAGLYHHALEFYTDIEAIKRCIVNTNRLSIDFMRGYFKTLSNDFKLICMRHLLTVNIRQNLQIVVQIAQDLTEDIGVETLIKLFNEEFNSPSGLFFYLGGILSENTDPDVHLHYIKAAVQIQHFKEVERVCRESNSYDPVKVKNFLMEAHLENPLPFIIVCNKYEMIPEMTKYLYKTKKHQHLEIYVQKINALQTPLVAGTLLDVGAEESFIRNLVTSVGNLAPIDEMVEQFEKRGNLKLIRGWLEALAEDGSTEPPLHNALAKIAVDLNLNPETFLKENPHYNSLVVGKYCEKRDPELAFIAYKRGLCDYELIDLTNENELFKHQSKYLISRKSTELWSFVLREDNPHRRNLIDQTISIGLPNTKDAEAVSTCVKAFLTAELNSELIELLEKLVLENGEFSNEQSLQNLLLLTSFNIAVENPEERPRVSSYIDRLNNFDLDEIPQIAITQGLFEEAFKIYSKSNLHVPAMETLVKHIKDLQRAKDYADIVADPAVWSLLGVAHLENDTSDEAVESAIKAFLFAKDPQHYQQVISAANRDSKYGPLVQYLQMVRKTIKDSIVETELLYSLAKIEELSAIEELLSGQNNAQVGVVGDRCYNEQMYKAAKILYESIPNYSRLASTLVRLGEFQTAFEAAKTANSTNTWKEVCFACVDAEQFKLAHRCGLNILVHADELGDILHYYQNAGHTEPLIKLIHAGTTLDYAHNGIFTELAILYSKYEPSKLLDFIKAQHTRLTIPKVLKQCITNHQWVEVVSLHHFDEEYDDAVSIMIDHPSIAWNHELFKDIIPRVGSDLMYKSVLFYLKMYPNLLNSVLTILSSRVSHPRIISIIEEHNHLKLIKPYLVATQELNLKQVNESLNSLYIDEEQYDSLSTSIDQYDNFDSLALANSLEKHHLLEFRRISSSLYARNKRFDKALELAKSDGLFRDCMTIASKSEDKELVSNLLKFFASDIGNFEGFSACLLNCYDLVEPDLVMELAWRHKKMDYAMPYLIQLMKEYVAKTDEAHEMATENKSILEKLKQKGTFLSIETAEEEQASQQPIDSHDIQAAFHGTDAGSIAPVAVQLTGANITAAPIPGYGPVVPGSTGLPASVAVAMTGSILPPASYGFLPNS